MSKFLEALSERRPDLDLTTKEFEHPIDKNNKYVSLYVNGVSSRFVFPESEIDSENPEEIKELVDITLMYIEKNEKNG